MREVFTNILATGQGEMLGFLHPRLFLIKKGFQETQPMRASSFALPEVLLNNVET